MEKERAIVRQHRGLKRRHLQRLGVLLPTLRALARTIESLMPSIAGLTMENCNEDGAA